MILVENLHEKSQQEEQPIAKERERDRERQRGGGDGRGG
jgi:hypothetical protein